MAVTPSRPPKQPSFSSMRLNAEDQKTLPLYLRELKKADSLSQAEEADLARRIRQGDQRALNKLVRANLRFVVLVAKNYQNRGLPLADLINEGNLGLIRAASHFDETKGLKFITYAVWSIRQAILVALSEQPRLIRIPLNRVGILHRINKASIRLEQKLGRRPTASDLAEALSLREEEVKECLSLTQGPASLDAPNSADGDLHLMDQLVDYSAQSPFETAVQMDLKQKVNASLSSLDEKERQILMLYFGLGSEPARTLEEIGYHFNVTRERVRQIKDQALRKLQHPSRSHRLAV